MSSCKVIIDLKNVMINLKWSYYFLIDNKKQQLMGKKILIYVGLPLVFVFIRTTTETITASISTPTVIASAVTAYRDRLWDRILLHVGSGSGTSWGTSSGTFLGFGKGGGSLTITGPTLLSLECREY